MSRVDFKTLKANDEYWESSPYGNTHCRVIADPVVDEVEVLDKMHKRYQWTAINVDTGEQIPYTITEGLEHYGPSLYTEPAYLDRPRLRVVK